MPRESIARVGRLLDESDEYVKLRPAQKPGKRAPGRRRPPALASTFVDQPNWRQLRYVLTRRFHLALGGDVAVTLPCPWKEAADPDEVLIQDPSKDPRIFWYARKPPVAPFTVRLSAIEAFDPGAGLIALGRVTDRALIDSLWPENGPPKGARHE